MRGAGWYSPLIALLAEGQFGIPAQIELLHLRQAEAAWDWFGAVGPGRDTVYSNVV